MSAKAIADRKRLVHLYHEETMAGLYRVCTEDSSDIERVAQTLVQWVQDHPERIDEAL
jgi:hypothetical protein